MSKKEPFKWRRVKEAPPAPAPKAEPAAVMQAPARVAPAPSIQEPPAPTATRPEGPAPSHGQIAALAYELWESQGWPHGADQEHWHEAERRLRANAR